MKKALLSVLALALFGGVFYAAVAAAFGGPLLFKSHSTGACVFWEDAAGRHDCASAPAGIEVVWVQ